MGLFRPVAGQLCFTLLYFTLLYFTLLYFTPFKYSACGLNILTHYIYSTSPLIGFIVLVFEIVSSE